MAEAGTTMGSAEADAAVGEEDDVAEVQVGVHEPVHEGDGHRLREVARVAGVPFVLVSLQPQFDVLRDRLTKRIAEGRSVSEADTDVLDHQLKTEEPLDGTERAAAVVVAGGDDDIAAAVARVEALLNRQ
jgi:hypothetical protein